MGTAIGAVLRHGVSTFGTATAFDGVWIVLAINLIGCLAMGALASRFARSSVTPVWLSAFLGPGVLGGFTTYSAFAFSAVVLADGQAWLTAFTFTVLSVIGSIACVALGRRVETTLGARQ